MHWEHITGNTEVISLGTSLVPLYHLSDREIVLFDSGAHPSQDLLVEFERRGIRVRAVLCTHMHPDHIANNCSLARSHDAEIYASAAEIELTQKTSLWLKEQGNEFDGMRIEINYPIFKIEDETELTIDGVKFAVLPTKGHSIGHLAFITPDGVCCFGDAMMSKRQLQYAKMPYMYDVDQAIMSMETIKQTRCCYYVAAHKEVVPDAEIEALVDANIKKELELYELLRQQVGKPVKVETAITDLMHAAGIQNPRIVEHWLMRQTVRARIEALVDIGEYRIEGEMIIPI